MIFYEKALIEASKNVLFEGIIYYVRKIYRKTNVPLTMIHPRTSAYQGLRDVSFSKNFGNVLSK